MNEKMLTAIFSSSGWRVTGVFPPEPEILMIVNAEIKRKNKKRTIEVPDVIGYSVRLKTVESNKTFVFVLSMENPFEGVDKNGKL